MRNRVIVLGILGAAFAAAPWWAARGRAPAPAPTAAPATASAPAEAAAPRPAPRAPEGTPAESPRTPEAQEEEREAEEAAFAVSGSVRDRATGDGVPNAEVTLTPQGEAGRGYGARSGADGAFSARLLEPGSFAVRASAEGFVPYERSEPLAAPGAESERVEIALTRTTRIEGVVVDAEGRPLEGAVVRASLSRTYTPEAAPPGGGLGWALRRFSSAQSGRDGRFRIDALEPGRYSVMAELDGYDSGVLQRVDALPGEASEARIEMAPGGRVLRGRVTNAEGAPISGARVYLGFDAPEHAGARGAWASGMKLALGAAGASAPAPEARTDAAGRYELRWSPKLAQMQVLAEAEGYARAAAFAFGLMEEGREGRLDFVLSPVHAVEVRVENAEGEPIPRAEVEARPPKDERRRGGPASYANNPMAMWFASTNEEGVARFEGVPAIDLTVSARGDEEYEEAADLGPYAPRDFPVRVVLKKARRYAVRGVVLGADGAPVRRFRVTIPGTDRADDDREIDAPDGRFAFEDLRVTSPPASGALKITASAAGYREGSATAPLDRLGDPVEIRLKAAGAIEGVVLGADGLPLAGATVGVLGDRGRIRGRAAATTDLDGRFSLADLDPGLYDVGAVHPDYALAAARGVLVSPGEAPARAEVRLTAPRRPEEGSLRRDIEGHAHVCPGFGVREAEDGYRVSSVAEDGSARAAGVTIGERAVRIDGRELAGMSLEEVRALMHPDLGTVLQVEFENEAGERRVVALEATETFE